MCCNYQHFTNEKRWWAWSKVLVSPDWKCSCNWALFCFVFFLIDLGPFKYVYVKIPRTMPVARGTPRWECAWFSFADLRSLCNQGTELFLGWWYHTWVSVTDSSGYQQYTPWLCELNKRERAISWAWSHFFLWMDFMSLPSPRDMYVSLTWNLICLQSIAYVCPLSSGQPFPGN